MTTEITNLNTESNVLLNKLAAYGEQYDKINDAVFEVVQTANDRFSRSLDIQDAALKKLNQTQRGSLKSNEPFMRAASGVFNAITGVLSACSALNQDIKTNNRSYSNTMFAITKSTIQATLTVMAGTATAGLLALVATPAAITCVAAISVGVGVGYLVGKVFDEFKT
ncbi:MAG: hypothetical protein LBE20_02240 [Deltaproteobacteria bacterium]|jgi:hypothetical protein|nr:hypothetical protein [Deltaproteobacteria bacterium]